MQKPHNFHSRTSADEVLAGQNITSKTYVVTGANNGIGYETARSLAGAGARVIFACRNEEKGRAAVAAAKNAHPGCRAEFEQLDLSSFDNIKDFASRLNADGIDALICNAGLFASAYAETAQGIESTVGVCHFGHYLLAMLLKDRLAAAGGRLVMVASESHRMPARLDFSRFPMNKDNFSSLTAYGQAKLCNVLFANEFERRFSSEGIIACSLHPGTLVTTNIASDNLLASLAMKAISIFTKNAAQGASTSVLCATWPDRDYIAGHYFDDCHVKEFSKEAGSHEVAARLWQISEEVCKI